MNINIENSDENRIPDEVIELVVGEYGMGYDISWAIELAEMRGRQRSIELGGKPWDVEVGLMGRLIRGGVTMMSNCHVDGRSRIASVVEVLWVVRLLIFSDEVAMKSYMSRTNK